jgi:hypothetical protein
MMADNFSSGLDDMKRKDQRDERKVMLALSKMTRFSIFEVTSNDTIAKMMDDIVARGLIETTGGQFPWTTFRITEAGQRVIDGASPDTGGKE